MAGTVTSTIDALTIANADISATAEIGRAKSALEYLKYPVPLEDLRKLNDAANAVLPNTATSAILGYIVGTIGTTGASVQTSDADGTTVTCIAQFTFELPAEYQAGQAISIVAEAGMKTNISNSTATLDFNCYYKSPADNTHSADLVSTSATTINSLTLSTKTFVVTPTSRVAGDQLAVKMTIAITDGGSGTAVLGMITNLHMLLGVRG